MLHNSVKVGSFGIKVFAKIMKKHSIENPLLYKSEDTKNDLAIFRFQKANYEVRVNVAKVMMAKSLANFVTDPDEKNRLYVFAAVHKQHTQVLVNEDKKWKR